MPTIFVLAAVLSLQFGGAVATLLFPRAGVHGVVALRLTIAALILLAVCRPWRKSRSRSWGKSRSRPWRKSRSRPWRKSQSRADWLTIGAFGVALAGLNTLFYHAIDRIPMGTAVTLEVLGPLTLSVVTARNRKSWLWAGLALAGVALLGREGFGRLDPAGVGFALGAAVMWAAYIVLSARVGHRFPKADGLALSVAVSAVIMLPFGVAGAGTALLDPAVVAMGAVVAVLASVLPYTLEMLALRRMPTTTFAVLMSLGPAVAATAGFLLLGQDMTIVECLAIALVITAAIGATRQNRNARTPSRRGARRTPAPAAPDASPSAAAPAPAPRPARQPAAG
ncbi:EamA family transporter [Actinoplanes sp. NPDC023714]|uniref:EamA family transporter n=1 Tax=Actinoplanes sp. NPDC023714 TaxID=3154322 RepID=UPI00340E7823